MKAAQNPGYRRHYERWHRTTLDHHKWMRRGFIRKYSIYLPSDRDARIVDVGCGMGFVVGALADLGFKNAEGIDLDQGQTDVAAQFKLPVTCVESSTAWLEARQSTFELVTCFDVIEHVPVPQQVKFVTALRNSLSPGGRLICTVPNANSALAARWRYIDYTHTCAFTEASLDFLLHQGMFEAIEITSDDERPRLPWLLRPSLRWWYLRQMFRFIRRIQFAAEIGWREASRLPLSLNLRAVCARAR